MHTLPQIQTLKGFLYLATAGGRRSWLSVTRASIDRTRKSEQVRLVLMCRRCRPLLNQTGNTLWVELSQRGNQKEKKGRGEVGDRAHLSCLLWRRALSLSVPLAEGPVVPTWRGGGDEEATSTDAPVSRGLVEQAASQKGGKLAISLDWLCCYCAAHAHLLQDMLLAHITTTPTRSHTLICTIFWRFSLSDLSNLWMHNFALLLVDWNQIWRQDTENNIKDNICGYTVKKFWRVLLLRSYLSQLSVHLLLLDVPQN